MLQHEWLLDPARLEMLMEHLRRFSPEQVAQAALSMGEPESEGGVCYTVTNGVAYIQVDGIIYKGNPWWADWLGMTVMTSSFLAEAIKLALADSNVSKVVLVFDTPGGTGAGIEALGNLIYENRAKIEAFVTDLCCSAGYWLASQCSKITALPGSEVGSIGVYRVLTDSSAMYSEMGMKVHLLRSGPDKGTGVSGVAISEAQLATEQSMIDARMRGFVGAVTRARGTPKDECLTGRTWLAEEALALGLIDAIGGLDSITAEMPEKEDEMPEDEMPDKMPGPEKKPEHKAEAVTQPLQTEVAELRQQLETLKRENIIAQASAEGRVTPQLATALRAMPLPLEDFRAYCAALPVTVRIAPVGQAAQVPETPIDDGLAQAAQLFKMDLKTLQKYGDKTVVHSYGGCHKKGQ